MYFAAYSWLQLVSFRLVLAATIPASPNLSAPTLDNASPPGNVASANQSELGNASPSAYTGPLNAEKVVRCDGANFGTGLMLHSCADALKQFDVRSSKIVSFNQRGTFPKAEHALPMRTSSSDGTCVIDVVRRAKNVYSRDYATLGQIREAATKIIRGCLDGFAVNDRGGYMGHVGQQGTLVVIVRKYEPKVMCGEQWAGKGDCTLTLDTLLVDTVPRTFGPQGQPGIAVSTPCSGRAETSMCSARIDLAPTRRVDSAAWYDIWAAGEAINAICVKRGKEGIATSIGNNRALSVSLLDMRSATS